MFMENQIRAANPNLQIVYQHCQKNLEDISSIARKNGAKIIFCTVGSNLKHCPPFASLHQADLTESEEKKLNEITNKRVPGRRSEDMPTRSRATWPLVRLMTLMRNCNFALADVIGLWGNTTKPGKDTS